MLQITEDDVRNYKWFPTVSRKLMNFAPEMAKTGPSYLPAFRICSMLLLCQPSQETLPGRTQHNFTTCWELSHSCKRRSKR